MKSMTCKQLGGACDKVFQAETFEEISALSKQHGSEMYKEGEPAHLVAMQSMQHIMMEPGGMQKWMAEKRELFDSLPVD